MKNREPEKLGSILESVLSSGGYFSVCKDYEVLQAWPAIVGEQLAEVTSCTRVEEGVLYVRVPAAPWRQEISYMKQIILRKIRSQFRKASIKDIVFY
jgi:predicted nucleic acid-binding Zn ribbon protein